MDKILQEKMLELQHGDGRHLIDKIHQNSHGWINEVFLKDPNSTILERGENYFFIKTSKGIVYLSEKNAENPLAICYFDDRWEANVIMLEQFLNILEKK